MNRQVTQDDVIYFVVTDRFFGRNKRVADPSDTAIHGRTLDGILEKLDYLIELGVTTVWVTPVYESIQGIDGSEPYHYGHRQARGTEVLALLQVADPRRLSRHLPHRRGAVRRQGRRRKAPAVPELP